MKKNNLFNFSKHHTFVVVGVLDMVHSTESVLGLSSEQIDDFYALFLSHVSKVLYSSHARAVKNIGDGFIWYFDVPSVGGDETYGKIAKTGFDLLEVCKELNPVLMENALPEVSFRVSMSYGVVSTMLNGDGEIVDIFGSTVNTCAKMNKHVPPDSFGVGEALNEKFQEYHIKTEKIADFPVNSELSFPVFKVVGFE